jgi:hypothetical protein
VYKKWQFILYLVAVITCSIILELYHDELPIYAISIIGSLGTVTLVAILAGAYYQRKSI